MFSFPNGVTILAPSTPIAYHPDIKLDTYWQLGPIDLESSGYAVPSTNSQHLQHLPAPEVQGEYQSNSQHPEYVRFLWLFSWFVSLQYKANEARRVPHLS